MKKKEQQQSEKPPSNRKDEQNQLTQDELGEEDLEEVSGGNVHLQDFHFVKKVDKASPTLL